MEHLKVTTTWPLPAKGGAILTLPDDETVLITNAHSSNLEAVSLATVPAH